MMRPDSTRCDLLPLRRIVGLACLGVLTLGVSVFAQAPGQTLLDQVRKAYQDVQAYDAKVTFKTEQQTGRWLSTQQTWYRIVFDRAGSRLMIDKPEFVLTVVDDSVRLVSEQLPGRFLDAAKPQPLTLSSLSTEVNMLEKPVLLDLAFLIEPDPIDLITNGGTSLATPLGLDPQDPKQRPRLQVGTREGELTMYFDPQTLLLDQAIFDLNFQGNSPDDFARLVYDFAYKDQVEIEDETFELQTQGLVAADNFQQMVTMRGAAAVAGGGGGTGSGAGPAASVTQQQQVRQAPPIKSVWVKDSKAELVVFKLQDIQEPIVVLHFWATWLPQAYKSIPVIESLRGWVGKNDLPVEILTINAGDQLQEVRRFMRVEERDVPVVLDREFEISEAYGANTLPLTVFIVDGKIVEVLNGYADNMEDLVRDVINAQVAKLKKQADAAPAITEDVESRAKAEQADAADVP